MMLFQVSFLELNQSIWGSGYEGDYSPMISRMLNNFFQVRGFETPGGVISAAFPYLFGIAGLILFVMLIWGSVEIFLGATSSKSVEAGKKRITTALIGFILLFSAFWIGQIISAIFGLDLGLTGSPTNPMNEFHQTR
jgi:hypothetical protein